MVRPCPIETDRANAVPEHASSKINTSATAAPAKARPPTPGLTLREPASAMEAQGGETP